MRAHVPQTTERPRFRRGHVVPGLKKYSMSLDEALIAEIDEVALANGKSRSTTVEILIRNGLKQMQAQWRNINGQT